VIHCLNNLHILIFFFEGKIDIWRKPTQEGEGPEQLGRSKRNSKKIMKFLHEWDLVKLLLFFLCLGVFSATSLIGCLPRELLLMTRLLGRLFNQWDSFLHLVESLLLDQGLKCLFYWALFSNQPNCLMLFSWAFFLLLEKALFNSLSLL